MKWIIARLAEPSTHAGIAALLVAGVAFFPAYAELITAIALAFGFTAVAKSG